MWNGGVGWEEEKLSVRKAQLEVGVCDPAKFMARSSGRLGPSVLAENTCVSLAVTVLSGCENPSMKDCMIFPIIIFMLVNWEPKVIFRNADVEGDHTNFYTSGFTFIHIGPQIYLLSHL